MWVKPKMMKIFTAGSGRVWVESLRLQFLRGDKRVKDWHVANGEAIGPSCCRNYRSKLHRRNPRAGICRPSRWPSARHRRVPTLLLLRHGPSGACSFSCGPKWWRIGWWSSACAWAEPAATWGSDSPAWSSASC